MSSCPNNRGSRTLFADDGDVTTYEGPPIFDEAPAEQQVDLLGDEGPLLVLRHAFCSPKIADDTEQRTRIFQSTCTINGKVCKFIIDSGACENIISGLAVSKLSLVTSAHPNPYNLSWLSRDTMISVTDRALVNFSIGGKYTDSIWCDIVPMDACHLLLGRPWQFDRRVLHDGFLNTYTLYVDGVKFVLHSSCPLATPTLASPSVLLLSRSTFEQELATGSPGFLLLGNDTSSATTPTGYCLTSID